MKTVFVRILDRKQGSYSTVAEESFYSRSRGAQIVFDSICVTDADIGTISSSIGVHLLDGSTYYI